MSSQIIGQLVMQGYDLVKRNTQIDLCGIGSIGSNYGFF